MLCRRYRAGETLRYRMRGVNDDRRYEARATVVVARDASGRFLEEITWYDLAVDGTPVPLPRDASHQTLSRSPEVAVAPPDLGRVAPGLVGPMLDLLTFYVDLRLAAACPLAKAGDRAVVPHGRPASWADGRITVLGEDAVDFDLTLLAVDARAKRAAVRVRHVPPRDAAVRLPAPWMREPVGHAPNNWVQVRRRDASTFVAAAGEETFDVVLDVSLPDGALLSATMENPVDLVERTCRDPAPSSCGPPRRQRILRSIEMHLER